jgi:Flp pilus assembly protein TadD
MMQFRLPPTSMRGAALGAVVLVVACGCANIPIGHAGGSGTRGPGQPLERINLAPTPADQDPLQNMLAGQFALTSGDLPAAARAFSQAARVSDDPALAAQATRVALIARQWDLAREDLARWQALRGEDPDVWQSRAILALHDGKTDVASVELSRLAAEPNGKGWSAIAQALIGAEDHDAAGALLERKAEALAWYEKVPADAEQGFGAQLRTAVLLDDTGKAKDAMSLVHDLQARAADDSKQLGETYLLEGEMLNRHQRGEEAIAAYDRGLQTLPDDTRLLYARALLNDDLNHVDAAVRDLRRVLELKPDDANAMNALGYTLADRTDNQKEAFDLINKAMTLKPGEPAIMDSLGWVQFRLGHLDAALTQLRTAFEKQPDAEIAAHLGEVLWAAGQKDEARKVWEQGRKKDAKNKVLLETIQRLSS